MDIDSHDENDVDSSNEVYDSEAEAVVSEDNNEGFSGENESQDIHDILVEGQFEDLSTSFSLLFPNCPLTVTSS